MTWLYRVTTNMCLSRLRDERNRARLALEHVELDREARPPDPRDQASARELIERMPRELAEVAIYYTVDGMTHGEIAQVLGCSRRPPATCSRACVPRQLAAIARSASAGIESRRLASGRNPGNR